MDALHTFFAFVDLAVWLLLLFVVGFSVPKPARSSFELQRLHDSGDGSVGHDLLRLEVYDRLTTIKNLTIAKCIVFLSLFSVLAFGWLIGIIIALGILLTKDRVSQMRFIRQQARHLYDGRETAIIHWVQGAHWLDWFSIKNTADNDGLVVASKEELLDILSRNHAYLQGDQYQRLLAGMSFDEKVIKDVMTPASMIDTAHAEDVLGPLVLDELHKTGHSRFPVIQEDIHHIVGILYIHNLLNTHDHKKTVKTAMESEVRYIHQDQTLSHALHGFLRTHRHLFIVVNDYRETVGVISLEDVLEALIGKKIIDEFDRFDDLRLVAESNPHKNNMPTGKKDI